MTLHWESTNLSKKPKQNNNPKTKKNIYTGSSGSLVLYGCDLIYY